MSQKSWFKDRLRQREEVSIQQYLNYSLFPYVYVCIVFEAITHVRLLYNIHLSQLNGILSVNRAYFIPHVLVFI